MRIAYIGNFGPEHSTETHIAATAEDMGHDVLRLQENEQVPGQLASKVKGCDLVLWTRTWKGFVSHQDLKDIEALDIPTVSWHLDLYIGLQRQSGLDDDPFWRTKFVFTPDGDPHSAEIFKSKGINHYYLRPGVYKAECNYGNFKPELSHDVIFVGGGIEYGHTKEWPYRRQLVQWLMDNYVGHKLLTNGSIDLKVSRFGKYGHPQPTMRNEDLNNLYSSAKIAIGDSVCINFDHTYYWSDRVYETLGRGGFIIHPYIRGMEQEFTGRENIVYYNYGEFDELKYLIDYYLEHNDERELIRKAGHEKVKADCTYHNRLQQMLDIVFEQEALKNGTVTYDLLGQEGERVLNEKIKEDEAEESSKWEEPIRLNLGAGADPTPDYINVDMLSLPGIDIVHNLMEFPYPFADNSASHIKSVDVVEHLDHYTKDGRPAVIAFIEECWRILKPGGELFIQTPRYDAEFLWIDVTHVRGFHEQSFDFFDETKPFGKTTGFYSKAKFSVRCEILPNKNLRFYMEKR